MSTIGMGSFEWYRHEEQVASMPSVCSIGVGPDALATCGLEPRALCALLRARLHDFIDGGANLLDVHGPAGTVTLYAVRRKRLLDAGTRKDFEGMGWGVVADLLDQTRAR